MATKEEIPRDDKGRFLSFTPIAPFTKKDMDDQPVISASIPSSTPAGDFAKTLRERARMVQDTVPLYRPSDNIFVSASGISDDSRPYLDDLWALSNIRIGPAWFVSNIMAADAVRNWHQFVDPDTRKPIKDEHTKAILKWAIKSDLRNQMHQLVRYERAMGTSFLMKYWQKDEKGKRDKEPPSDPPRKFRAFSPRYMTPINLGDTNELNYNEEVWRFSGGVFAEYSIHRDRVHPLTTRPEEGNWRGLSVHEPVWLSEIGYMQSFIFLVKRFRQFGSVVPIWAAKGFEPIKEVAMKYMDLLDEYTNELKFVMNNEDKLIFQETQIGKGLGEAFEQYKEDMSSAWRVPMNQLFGRSVGGGLEGAGALVSKEDYIQEISNIQMSLTDDTLTIYTDAGWDVEAYDLEWLMAIRKTDEQKLREEGMEWQNKILKENLKGQKLQNKMLQMQIEQQEVQQITGVIEGEGQEPPGGVPPEEGEEQPPKQPSDFMKRYWGSIRIDNHIQFPYGDKRGGY